jgi:cytoskeleton-associated protein 5
LADANTRLFGTEAVPPKPILKVLPKIFAHTDKVVRSEGTLLTQALYQYIGPALDPFLADLKPVQVKELKESFDALEAEGKGRGTLKPERLTRARAREVEQSAAAGEEILEETAETEGISGHLADSAFIDLLRFVAPTPLDPRAFAEEVNVLLKFPTGYQAALASSKWKERKEALDEMLSALQAALRIQPAPEFSELSKTFAVMIQKDANVVCVMAAAGCLEALSKGLGEQFGRFREAVVPPMLERLKERKANVTDAIGTALDAIFNTVSTRAL